ncbi:hypothetical protein MCOR21_011550 [Pyricularia oryzae]|uniref:Aldehyde dehydrogenase domain-containing protein n=1 Tax=Pyricularia oryzae TaxID=318829 RepID=A0A4P7NT04_PYROR|nr:hypothetical protein MCOR01_010175 [Pyricularia oryzae]KAI6266259.1 hypothetical protein MCOR26_010283 [Pyricularia oryzae]KAI6333535.1 hypothetical protein MCOR28_010462 [Pyricularia oryzae]KAI6414841.1 hypothetical protein MCOR21_011550 [Pyricularia oryzae]KAI6429288.1 hypothetical protein MCOR22_010328 [Pyricularia oryzae]
MFRAAGFPLDVVNFVIHRPEDAQGYSKALISHPARECNFTGSTAVGRQVAARAANAPQASLDGAGWEERRRRAAECGPKKGCRDGAAWSAAGLSVARSIEPEYNAQLCKTARRTRTSWQTHPDSTRKKQVHKPVTRTYKACTLDWESVVPPGVMQCATRQ